MAEVEEVVQVIVLRRGVRTKVSRVWGGSQLLLFIIMMMMMICEYSLVLVMYLPKDVG